MVLNILSNAILTFSPQLHTHIIPTVARYIADLCVRLITDTAVLDIPCDIELVLATEVEILCFIYNSFTCHVYICS